MDVEVVKQKKLPLLNRERVTGFVHFDSATPSRLDIKKAVAKKINAKEDFTVIRHVYQRFGERKAKIIAHIYEDASMMKKLEPENLMKKHTKKEEKKEEAKETPKEEKKSE
ncbi:hypothetical protein COV16_01205 [Candidatus Woesearchaeota archaeon CG10_big_fil_rev_8_21_14_0_10_34_8]|nr:MAG: hypothetical protein COV16_01205 [Candidatus Woesearchaeota archaeon CG10_big_fil_rev_8_21_14_0_10_34_8]